MFYRLPRPASLLAFGALASFAALRAAGTDGADIGKSLGDTANAASAELKGWVRRNDADMNRWRDNRVGVFIHFGLYSVFGGEYRGKVVPAAGEWIKASGIPDAEYAAAMKDFTLEKFDAREWVRAVKAMGGKYIGITTKHHDGFCLWPSKLTDYSVASTPSRRDILKELSEACKAEGVDLELYYSIIDWHHPDFMAKLPRTPEEKAAYARYIEFLKGQCKELLSDYGDIKGLWFDGRWDPAYKLQPQIGKDLEAYLRQLRPGIVLADRVRAYDSFADYNSGYERKLPTVRPPLDWECCTTMTTNSWGYHKSWSGDGWKTPKTLVRWISHSVGMGGNIMINIGPRGDGSLNPGETVRMEKVGRWLHDYADVIYGTDGFTLPGTASKAGVKPGAMQDAPSPGPFATISKDGKTVNIILNDWPETDKLRLPGLPGKIKSAVLRAPGGASTPIPIVSDGNRPTGLLPMSPPDDLASVITLTLE